MPQVGHPVRARPFTLFTAYVAVVVGSLALLGWVADIATLRSVFPGFATMKVNTALLLTLTGTSLAMVLKRQRPEFRIAALLCNLSILALSVLTLVQYASALNFGIDELFYHDSVTTGPSAPGRMSYVTATVFVLFSLALLLLHSGYAPLFAQALSTMALIISSICCLTYLSVSYHAQSVVPFTSLAVHTAFSLLIVSLGLLTVSPQEGVIGLLVSDGVGGVLVRRLLPTGIVVPLIIGWLEMRGEQAGWYGAEVGIDLFALSNISVFTGLVFWTASDVQNTEERRKIADNALRESEQRYRLLLEGVPQLIWTCLPDGRCDYLSRQWVEYTGISEADQLGQGWMEALHPEDRTHLMKRWPDALAEQKPLDFEFRLLSKAGEYRWFKTRAVLFRRQDGSSRWFGTNTDIHDKKLAEEELRQLNVTLEQRVIDRTKELRESEERFRAIFHSQFQFICLLSASGVLLEANRTALDLIGTNEAVVLGTLLWGTPWWAHDPSQQDCLQVAVRRAAEGYQERFEVSHPTRDGKLIWVDFSLTPFRDEKGEVVLLIAEGRDITERRQTEETLREQEERFRGAFEYAAAGVALVAPGGRWLRVNRSLCEIIGYEEAELLVTDFQSLTHPDDLAADLHYISQLLAGEIRSYQMDKRYFHKLGHSVNVRLSVSLVRDGMGKPLYFVSQIIDITKWKEVQRALTANEALLHQFIKHSPAAIAMLDRDLRYLQMSDRWMVDFHLNSGDIVGLSFYEAFPANRERWKGIHSRVLSGTEEGCEEEPFQRADGSIEWLQWECLPWRNAAGEIGGMIVFTQFITQRKLAEEQTRASLREKDVLLREIHHRVKNNLQIVSALLDLQSNHTNDPQALEMFQESRGRVKSMALIHERLYRSQDMSRVNFTDYVRQLADDLYNTYKLSEDAISLKLEIDIPPLPIDVAIPCGLLLNELISNCFKHAFSGRSEGCIHVALFQNGDKSNVLSVSDDGVGFPKDTDFRNTSSFGLQLVNTLVDQLGGEIELITDGGTTLIVRFSSIKT